MMMVSGLAWAYPVVPDPTKTSGELCNINNPDYREKRYPEQIPYCTRKLSFERRKRIYDAYGISEKCRSSYTIDHFFPLSLGGDNADINLWPEHKLVKATRPQLEQELFENLRTGTITQATALHEIRKAKTKATEMANFILFLLSSGNACDRPSAVPAEKRGA